MSQVGRRDSWGPLMRFFAVFFWGSLAAVAMPPGPPDKSPTLDVNDVSILFPLDGDRQPYPNIPISEDLWPNKGNFRNLMDFSAGMIKLPIAGSKELIGMGHIRGEKLKEVRSIWEQLGVLNWETLTEDEGAISFLLDRTNALERDAWRIVSFRVDPCATPIGDQCFVELRLIAQPVRSFGLGFNDFAAHLLYGLGPLQKLPSGQYEFADPLVIKQIGKFSHLLSDLQKIKAATLRLARRFPEASTDGRPLGVHPGLITELETQKGRSVAVAVENLIGKWTQLGLTFVTSMQVAGLAQPWVFFQGQVVNSQWLPIPITGNPDQFSIRTNGADEDRHNHGELPSPTQFFPRPDTLSTSIIFGEPTDIDLRLLPVAHIIDNPGTFGALDLNPKVTVHNTDCISCHTSGTRITRPNLKIPASGLSNRNNAPFPDARDRLYRPIAGITGYADPAVLTRKSSEFRNFGYMSIGPQVSTRVTNESAEVARFLNFDVLKKDPRRLRGYACPDEQRGIRRSFERHAALYDCLVTFGTFRTTFEACVAQVGCFVEEDH